MFLEDARPANDRALEVPREMRLSLLRWDYPETGKGGPGRLAAAAATSDRVAATTSSAGGTSLASSREGGGGRAPPGGRSDEPGGATETETPDGRPEDDQ